jgi:hypothetical protein
LGLSSKPPDLMNGSSAGCRPFAVHRLPRQPAPTLASVAQVVQERRPLFGRMVSSSCHLSPATTAAAGCPSLLTIESCQSLRNCPLMRPCSFEVNLEIMHSVHHPCFLSGRPKTRDCGKLSILGRSAPRRSDPSPMAQHAIQTRRT